MSGIHPMPPLSNYRSPYSGKRLEFKDNQQVLASNHVCFHSVRYYAYPSLLDRYDTEKMTTDELKTIIWRYFISYLQL